MWPWNRNLKDGYIGVTHRNPKDRWNEHQRGDLAQKIDEHGLDVGDMHIRQEGLSGAEAREFERKYRPKPNMGWNKRPGGGGIADDKLGHYVYHISPRRRVGRLVKWFFRMDRK